MLKQISAALLAASLLTAPALAAEGKSTSTTPATTSTTAKAPDSTSTSVKSSNKSVSAKPGNAMNANAKVTTTAPAPATPAAKPDVKKVKHGMRHHRGHTTVGSNRVKSQKVASIKHIPSPKSAIKVQPSKS
jgi:anti-sigma28 factor (negative regulator of flagellin synthesis)